MAGEDFDDDEQLWLLGSPREIVWEIRITFNPHWRIFGCFTRPGEFILAHHKSRELLEIEGFPKHIKRCETLIDALFPGCQMCTRAKRSDLLQEF